MSREDTAALLERLAHHVRAGIVIGEHEAIPIDDELAVQVVVARAHDETRLGVKLTHATAA